MRVKKSFFKKYADEVDYQQMHRAEELVKSTSESLDFRDVESTLKSIRKIILLLNDAPDIVLLSPKKYGVDNMVLNAYINLKKIIENTAVSKEEAGLNADWNLKNLNTLIEIRNQLLTLKSYITDEEVNTDTRERDKIVNSLLTLVGDTLDNLHKEKGLDVVAPTTPYEVVEYTRYMPGEYLKLEEDIKKNFEDKLEKERFNITYQQSEGLNPESFRFKTDISPEEMEGLETRFYQLEEFAPNIFKNVVKNLENAGMAVFEAGDSPTVNLMGKESEVKDKINEIVNFETKDTTISPEAKEALVQAIKETILTKRMEKLNSKTNNLIKLASKFARKYF